MIISNDNINDSFREGLSSLNVFKNDEGLTQRCYHRARRDIDEVFGIKNATRDSNWKILLNTLICTRFYCKFMPINDDNERFSEGYGGESSYEREENDDIDGSHSSSNSVTPKRRRT